MFPLCRSCAEQCNQDHACNHGENDRALVGTWVSVELFRALDSGYRLLRVYEVWHFESTEKYVKGDHSHPGIFSGYVDRFLKLKKEASSSPPYCYTVEEQNAYKKRYFETKGVALGDVCKNEGLRSFAKILLNCLREKLAQRPILPKTEYVQNVAKYFQLIEDPCNIVKHVAVMREDIVLVNYECTTDFATSDEFGIVITAYVTANARLKLFEALEILQDRVLYFDSDSCIYIYNPSMKNPIVGEKLDDWIDEHPRDFIVSFVSGGPKHNGYRYRDTDCVYHTICKVKVLTLNYRCSQVVNFVVLKEALTSGEIVTLALQQ